MASGPEAQPRTRMQEQERQSPFDPMAPTTSCGTILHSTLLYYNILYYTILYYTILYYTILYYTILYYTILYYTILYYTILYYTILYYTILYYTILYYTILYYTILYYTILYYTILYYTILYYTASGIMAKTLQTWLVFGRTAGADSIVILRWAGPSISMGGWGCYKACAGNNTYWLLCTYKAKHQACRKLPPAKRSTSTWMISRLTKSS